MAETENQANELVSLDEIQKDWHDLTVRVAQLETERGALEQENKALQKLLERVIEHRQKSHNELVLILSGLVSKLPINDVGAIVGRLVEHNSNVCEYLAALGKGTAEVQMPEMSVLKTLDHAKRDLAGALKPVLEELTHLDTPLEKSLLPALAANPELFFSPRMVRANRCFIKGLVPRERIVREFGEEALVFFTDMSTDPKLNRNPKPEEIVLAFKNDFETLFQQNPGVAPQKRDELMQLYRQVQRSKGTSADAHAQRVAFQKLSFLEELLHYYCNQNTEAPDLIFAQRLPALVEQLVLGGGPSGVDEKLVSQAEELLAHIVSPEHRQMVINNVGKGSGTGRTLKYVLRLRSEKAPDQDQVIAEFLRHLFSGTDHPRTTPETLLPVVRLIHPEMQRQVIKAIFTTDRLPKSAAEALGKAVGEQLGLKGVADMVKAEATLSPEMERQLAWEKVKEQIKKHGDAASIASVVRERLNSKYNSEEIRESWITLTEADSMTLIRVFCHLPYLPSGKTDPIARPVLETYVSRLTHDKYASTLHKVVNSLKGMHKAKPDSPTLMNFLALVRWVDPAAADRLSAEIGIGVASH